MLAASLALGGASLAFGEPAVAPGDEPKADAPAKPEPVAPAPGSEPAAANVAPRDPVQEAARHFLRAMRLYESGEYEKAIERFGEIVRTLDPAGAPRARAYRAAILYRTACAHAALGRADPAFRALDAAIRAGYRDLDALETDGEFDHLRADPRFEQAYRLARSLKG